MEKLKQSPVEAMLQEKFERAYYLQQHNNYNFRNLLEKNGFTANSGGNFQVLANKETGETIVEMYRDGKLPKSLIGYVDYQPQQIEENLTWFMDHLASSLPPNRFQRLAKKLEIPNADKLILFEVKTKKNLLQKLGNALDKALDDFAVADKPWV